MNRRQLLKISAAGFLAALGSQRVWAASSTTTIYLASVVGTRVGKGKAKYQSNASGSEKELEIELEKIGLPVGTVLTVTIGSTTVGTATVYLELGVTKAKLKLKTSLGQTVPAIVIGDVITILNGTETAASGTFATTTGGTGGGTGGGTTTKTILAAVVTGTVVRKGKAKYQANLSATEKELEIELERISLPTGTVLTIQIAGGTVGTATVTALKKAKLTLKTSLGQTVPKVAVGDSVTILNGTTTVASGTFAVSTI